LSCWYQPNGDEIKFSLVNVVCLVQLMRVSNVLEVSVRDINNKISMLLTALLYKLSYNKKKCNKKLFFIFNKKLNVADSTDV